MIKPVCQYRSENYIFEQSAVLLALGITIKDGEHYRLTCDGTNKVIIEMWRYSKLEKRKKK